MMDYIALSLAWILASIGFAWSWHRWQRKTVGLDEAGFERWMRANRPPLPWFLGLQELEQERLAQLGDLHSQDVCLGIGYAVRDPDIAKAGRDPQNIEGETALLELMLRGAMARTPNAQPQHDRIPQPTMGGIKQRQTKIQERKAEERASGLRLFGRAPDRSAP